MGHNHSGAEGDAHQHHTAGSMQQLEDKK